MQRLLARLALELVALEKLETKLGADTASERRPDRAGRRSYLGSGREDLDAAVVADVGGRVQQLPDVADDPVQLGLGGHHVVAGPDHKKKKTLHTSQRRMFSAPDTVQGPTNT